MNLQPTLFDAVRMDLTESINLTAESLRTHGAAHETWAVAYSGGKDSTATASIVLYLIRSGRVPAPKRLVFLYADTRMELPPLAEAADRMLAAIRAEGFETRVVVAPMNKRFFVYMLGRGIPPPNNSTFRWCTRQIKVEPMAAEVASLVDETEGKILMLTGVRLGESAARDGRIALSCSTNKGECGQGWYQEALAGERCATLAPILHWRTCLVWDYLALPDHFGHGLPTQFVADAYGVAEDGSRAEQDTRTGCNGCPLATVDSALDNLLRLDRWAYLAPLKELRPLYRWLREPAQRLRKENEVGPDGVVRFTNRMGPLTIEARLAALGRVLSIQERCNLARPIDAPMVDTINLDEQMRIYELINANTWPNRWDGTEPRGDAPFRRIWADGSIQEELFQEGVH